MKYALLLLLPLVLLAAKCNTKQFTLGETVTLAPGEPAICSDCADLALVFMDVTEDSRCPRNVNCIQAGQATVRLGVGESDPTILTFTLAASAKDSSPKQRVGDYQIQVLALDPYPEDGKAQIAENYRLQLVVTGK